MRTLIAKFPEGYEGWARERGETPAPPPQQRSSSVFENAGLPEVDQLDNISSGDIAALPEAQDVVKPDSRDQTGPSEVEERVETDSGKI
jgi:hypothetical protein